ncbi:MAG TPA: tetratricopeptide repeat protein, partial [bacterium]|nr:tetratricopeptide repeat protein [bacterium]
GAALAAAVTFAVFHNHRIAAERDRAQYQAETADSVSEFLISVFLESDPDRSDDHEATVRDVLARGAERVLADVEGDPAVRARLLDALGEVQRKLGRLREAEPLLEEGLALRRQALDPRDPEILSSLGHLASLRSELGDPEASLALNREIYARAMDIHGEDHVETVVRLHNLGTALRNAGELAEAEEVLRRSLAGRRRHFGDEHIAVANAVGSLANLVRDQERYEEAAELYAEALRLSQTVYGEDHVRVASIWHNLGRMQVQTNRREEAEHSLDEALRIRRAAYGDDSLRLESTLATRGALRTDRGDLAGAEEDYREALDLASRHVGPRSRAIVAPLTALGRVFARGGRTAEADSTLAEAIAIAQESYGEGHAAWGEAVDAYVEFLEQAGREQQAAAWRERAKPLNGDF